jgi:AraC family transcriptional regulator
VARRAPLAAPRAARDDATVHRSVAPAPLDPDDERLRVRIVAGLHVTEWRHRAGYTVATHAAPDATLSLVLAGQFVERVVRQRHAVRRTDTLPVCGLWCHAAGLVYGCEVPPGGVHMLSVRVTSGASARVHDALNALAADGLAVGGAEVRALGVRLRNELWRSDDLSALGTEVAVAELVYRSGAPRREHRHARAPLPWLLGVRARLRDECRRSDLSLDTIAADEEVDPTSLARAFRRAFGVGPAAFTRECRLAWAVDALDDAHRSLSEIALDAGFADHSHFTRAFRARFGVAPREWRLAARAGRRP